MKNADGKGRSMLKIYEATRGQFDWENVQELPFNGHDFTCMHPALSPDESKLFFTSNRPGGFGGMDIYVSEWNNGRWSAPVNLGPEINTSKNEAFPFFHESGTLFFASDGHKGSGRLDIFMVDMSERTWGKVYNLGAPFNSPEDDLGLVLVPDGTSGYFTSARSGGFGQDDVYMFRAPKGLRGIRPIPTLSGLVTVTDKALSRRMAGASIRLFETNQDGLVEKENIYEMELTPTDGEGDEMVMKLIRKKDDDLGAPLTQTDRNGEALVTLQPDKNYLLLVSKADYFTKELLFSTDDLGPDKPLDILLEPTNCILLTGKVKSDRFQIPIPNATVKITNLCDNSIQTCRSNIRGDYEICLPIGCDYTLESSKDGYEPGKTQVTTVRLRGSRSLAADVFIHPTSDAILKEPIREGTVIVLENIYYDFNKSAIRKGAAQDLEALAQLMLNYPSMQIELGAHTDSRGTNAYNEDLSLRRADSAKEFLIQNGIAGERIRTVGYGETRLRNHCNDDVECSEEEHKINRRTEVKVLNIDERVKITNEEGGGASN
ncbi:MAG: OmpA family protein [Saprospiraceae bacterium]